MKEAEKNNKIENFRLIIYKIAYLLMIEKKSLLNFYEYVLLQGFQRLCKTENFIVRLIKLATLMYLRFHGTRLSELANNSFNSYKHFSKALILLNLYALLEHNTFFKITQ